MSDSQPETYYLEPTKFVPNSKHPVLVYRSVLPTPVDEESATEFLQRHNWTKLVSRSPKDNEDDGMKLDVSQGDVLVIPAGISHCSLETRDDYRVIGMYPDVSIEIYPIRSIAANMVCSPSNSSK
ncbi:hypothetical protein TRICI_005455 [Trichomonascus ciferrii]|uniref:Uncharacterized protein n=1 Tax=Trichomonascus ciferrii TaxID=44093 RepID=A0A642USP6_9ASCO|nr:hypothetical protein TRICI_005455 [Trichomonascus ciferrii]